MFKFSLITATYNRLPNLNNLYDCIIKNKNYLFNIEWVVIVEKEDIETIKFLRKVLKKNIQVKILINKYKGVFNRLIKQGVANCTGDYLIVIGDDDLILKNSLIDIYNFIKKKKPLWIVTPVNYHSQNKKIIRKFITKVKTILIFFEINYLLKIINYYMTPGVIISRNLISKVNYFDQNSGTSNDWSTWLKILDISKPLVLKKTYFSAGYSFDTISGGLNYNKYFDLIRIISGQKINFITKILGYLIVFIIFISNFFFKNINFIKSIIIKPKILNEKKEIIHITRQFNQNYQTGGIEQFIFQTSQILDYKLKIISYSNKVDKVQICKNYKLFLFKKTFTFLNDFFSFKILFFLIKQSLSYKLIHLHQPHLFSYFYILLLPFQKKIIVTHHSDILRHRYLKIFFSILDFIIKRNVNLYHFSSKIYKRNCRLKKVKNYFIESFSIKKKIIRKENIRINLVKNLPKKYVLFVGRNRHYKGLDKLKKIILSNLHVNFVCVSDYKFNLKTKNLTIFKKINDDEKLYLFKNSHILINTSDNLAESFGFSILEALSFGVPSIVFRLNSGTNYLIQNNINGYIINNFNIKLFSKKIDDLYNNSKLYKTFKKNTILDYKRRLNHNYETLNNKYNKLLS